MTTLKEFDVVRLRDCSLNIAEHITGLYHNKEYTIVEVCSARDSVRIFLPEVDEFRWLWSDRFVRVPQKDDFFYGFTEGTVKLSNTVIATAHLSMNKSLVMLDRAVSPPDSVLDNTIYYFKNGLPLYGHTDSPKIVSWNNFVINGGNDE